jgi:MoaA/NifB/PqqE/SkfB family radical SAM enzyme
MLLTSAPLYVSWNYTYACNFNCSHCYSRAAAYPRELDSRAYRDIVDQFIEANVMRVGLGGGEPLIRRDCVEIIARMAAGFIQTNITTNAWFLSADKCNQLADAGLSILYVSLDSLDSEKHDQFRNRRGSFDRVVVGIRNAVQAGLKVKLSTVLTTINSGEIEEIVGRAEDWGIAGVEFKRFRPIGNGKEHVADYTLSSRDGDDVRRRVDEANHQSDLEIALIYGAESDGRTDSGCPCGIRSITLRPNGDVAPCAYESTVIGNIIDDRLLELWRNSPQLRAMREAGSCSALKPGRSPSARIPAATSSAG